MKLARWQDLPHAVQEHLVLRMEDRGITVKDLSRLRSWRETSPDVPEGDWYKDFGSFILCGRSEFALTFLTPGQEPYGTKI